MCYSPVSKTLMIVAILHMASVAFGIEFRFGRSEKWQRFVGLDNVQIINNLTDNSSVQLAPTANTEPPIAELFLDFERPNIAQSFSSYTLADTPNFLLGQPKVGQYSGLFTTRTEPLLWFPHSGSIFSSETDNASFTIQLWVNPNGDGGTIMSWGSLSVVNVNIAPYIDFVWDGQSFEWNIRNLFSRLEDGELAVIETQTLTGSAEDVGADGRNGWTHHHLQYNAQRHYIAYRIDGTLVDVVYTTDNKTSAGTPVYKSVPPNFEGVLRIGTSYSGHIDNFQITADMQSPQLKLFAGSVGIIQSEVIDLMGEVGYLDDIEIVAETPPHTEIVTEYRMSPRRASLVGNTVAWNRLPSNTVPPPGIIGRYLQLRISLYPDGSGEFTPVLHEIGVTIDPIQLPLAPQLLTVSAGDQKIDLSWKPQSLALGEVHYRVLFGTEEDILNRSITVGDDTSISVTGLENGQIYYFVVEPFLPNLSRVPGDRTEIVSARPFAPTPQP